VAKVRKINKEKHAAEIQTVIKENTISYFSCNRIKKCKRFSSSKYQTFIIQFLRCILLQEAKGSPVNPGEQLQMGL